VIGKSHKVFAALPNHVAPWKKQLHGLIYE